METTSSCGEGAGRTALHLIEIEEWGRGDDSEGGPIAQCL